MVRPRFRQQTLSTREKVEIVKPGMETVSFTQDGESYRKWRQACEIIVHDHPELPDMVQQRFYAIRDKGQRIFENMLSDRFRDMVSDEQHHAGDEAAQEKLLEHAYECVQWQSVAREEAKARCLNIDWPGFPDARPDAAFPAGAVQKHHQLVEDFNCQIAPAKIA